MCRKVPYGFEMRDGRMLPREEEAAGIRAFFESYLSGASLADAKASAKIPLTVVMLRKMMENGIYAKIVGEESLCIARAEAARRGAHLRGWKRRREEIVIPMKFRLEEGEKDMTRELCVRPEEVGTLQELYNRIIPVW